MILVVTFIEPAQGYILRPGCVSHLASQQLSGKGAVILPILSEEKTEAQRERLHNRTQGHAAKERSSLPPEPHRLLWRSNGMIHTKFLPQNATHIAKANT